MSVHWSPVSSDIQLAWPRALFALNVLLALTAVAGIESLYSGVEPGLCDDEWARRLVVCGPSLVVADDAEDNLSYGVRLRGGVSDEILKILAVACFTNRNRGDGGCLVGMAIGDAAVTVTVAVAALSVSLFFSMNGILR